MNVEITLALLTKRKTDAGPRTPAAPRGSFTGEVYYVREWGHQKQNGTLDLDTAEMGKIGTRVSRFFLNAYSVIGDAFMYLCHVS